MGKVVLIPSLMGRYAKLISASKSKAEVLEIIENMELLFELGVFHPPDDFWPLMTKLVKKKVELMSLKKRQMLR